MTLILQHVCKGTQPKLSTKRILYIIKVSHSALQYSRRTSSGTGIAGIGLHLNWICRYTRYTYTRNHSAHARTCPYLRSHSNLPMMVFRRPSPECGLKYHFSFSVQNGEFGFSVSFSKLTLLVTDKHITIAGSAVTNTSVDLSFLVSFVDSVSPSI